MDTMTFVPEVSVVPSRRDSGADSFEPDVQVDRMEAQRQQEIDIAFATVLGLLEQARNRMTAIAEGGAVNPEDLKRNAQISIRIAQAAKGSYAQLMDMCIVEPAAHNEKR